LGVDKRTSTIGRALLALLVVVAVEGCGGGPSTGSSPASSSTPTMAASDAPMTRATATLGIYSGRLDPTWELAEAQAEQVAEALAALPTRTGTPVEGGLGYHGFTLLLRRSEQADATLVAYRGIVAPQGVGPRSCWIDVGRAVERLLLDTGRPVLTPTEVAVVEADLAAVP